MIPISVDLTQLCIWNLYYVDSNICELFTVRNNNKKQIDASLTKTISKYILNEEDWYFKIPTLFLKNPDKYRKIFSSYSHDYQTITPVFN